MSVQQDPRIRDLSGKPLAKADPAVLPDDEPIVDLTSASASASLEHATTPHKDPRGKRALDIALGLFFAFSTIPLQLLGLFVSAVAFRSYPIFTQKRLGRHGELFTFFKIRSLPSSAPSEAAKHDLRTVENTLAGKFLRKTHLDELLQFWSVIKGDMSIVGPRPEMVGLSASYDPEFVRQRTKLRPGITGLWQISDACDELIGDAPGYDLYYLQNQSLKLDFWIMRRTTQKMFLGRTVDFTQLDATKAEGLRNRTALQVSDAK